MGIYGTRNGVFTTKDLTVKNDLTIQGDMSFGDASTDTLSVTGAATFSNTITVGVDDTGYDVKFFGATSGAYMLWDESADDLILAGAAGLSVAGATSLNELSLNDAVSITGADAANTLTWNGTNTGITPAFAFPDDTYIADADGAIGAAAGFIIVDIGGSNYKLQTYALS